MANPFDQFDAAVAESNPFDRFDEAGRLALEDQLSKAADRFHAVNAKGFATRQGNPNQDAEIRAVRTKLENMPAFGSPEQPASINPFDQFDSVRKPPEQSKWGGFKDVVEAAQPLYEQSVDAIRAAAAKPWRMIQNIGEQVFPLPAAVTQYARHAAETLETPTTESAQTLPEKIVRGTVQGAAELPSYALAAAAGGAPALAAMGAAQELHRGGYAAAAAAGQNALLGMIASPLSEFTKPSQAMAYGTVNALMTASQGGDLSDIVASAVSGAGLAVPGGGGKKSISGVIPEKFIPDFTRRSANPAAEIRALRGSPEGETSATTEGAGQKGVQPEREGSGGQLQADRANRNLPPDLQEEGNQAGGGNRLQPAAEEPGSAGPIERRTNLAERARVDQMTPEQMRAELLTDPLTGMPNRRAYMESEKLPVTASIDVDGLKWINDNLGHEAGDQLIRQVAGALKDHNAYHISGDEFVAQFPDRESARAAMAQFQDTLRNSKFEFEGPNGEKYIIDGPGASHGIGDTPGGADAALRTRKLEAGQTGERAQRGEPPPRLTRVQPEGVPAADSGTAAGEQVQPNNSRLGAAQGGAVSIAGLEPIARAVTGTIDATKPVVADLGMKVTPIDVGSRRAAGAASELASMKRAIDWDNNQVVRILTKNFTPIELTNMWNRMSEESVARQLGKDTRGTGTGLDALTMRQRETVMALQERSANVAKQAVELGLLKDPMDIYDPRKFIEVLPDGTRKTIVSGTGGTLASSPMAGGVRTSSPHLRARKHMTAEESEAAAKAKLGEAVQLVRDVRVLPIVTAQLEHAVVGKRFINQIRQWSKAAGDNTDAPLSYQPSDRYFTLPENPAFYEYRYLGKNEDGTPNIQRMPIYIHKDFEGPLKAVLESREPGPLYKGFMYAKNANSALVMANPLIHNMVIWAKALPFMPGKVASLRAYVEGHGLRQDPAFMRRSIEAGTSYVDSHQFQQEVLQQRPDIELATQPGRGLLAMGARKAIGLVSPEAGRTTAAAIDRVGAFWHQTLLWNRIGDLQASIFNTVSADLQTKGMPQKVADLVAGRYASLFGGSIPREELSATANKIANVSLFSKSFTGTNLALYLDALRGLPKSVQGRIANASGEAMRAMGNNYARRTAFTTVLKDVALLYGFTALTQTALEKMRDNKSLDQIAQGYTDRFSAMWKALKENPFHVLNTPFESLQSLLPQGGNEPGKKNRILLGYEKTGQALYGKPAVGKTAEDLLNVMNPSEMLHNKLSANAQFASNLWANQDYFGRRIYDKDAKGMAGVWSNAGQIAKAFITSQIPSDTAQALWSIAHGDERKVTEMKTMLPQVGVSVSRGSAKGPQGGVVAEAMRQHAFQVQQGTKLGLDLIDQGRIEDAYKAMTEEGMTPQEALMLIKYRNQYGRGTMRKFFETATPDQIDNFYRLQK